MLDLAPWVSMIAVAALAYRACTQWIVATTQVHRLETLSKELVKRVEECDGAIIQIAKQTTEVVEEMQLKLDRVLPPPAIREDRDWHQ